MLLDSCLLFFFSKQILAYLISSFVEDSVSQSVLAIMISVSPFVLAIIVYELHFVIAEEHFFFKL